MRQKPEKTRQVFKMRILALTWLHYITYDLNKIFRNYLFFVIFFYVKTK